MSTSTSNDFFSEEELQSILNLSETRDAKKKLEGRQNGTTRFFIDVTPPIRQTLEQKFGMDLELMDKLPLRWIKGDTPEHVDVPSSDSDKPFNNTYLVQLNDSVGDFVIGEETYPIQKNTGFVFPEGIKHSAINTGQNPRLLLGPMSGSGIPVGRVSAIVYYRTLDDAINHVNELARSDDYFTVGQFSYVDVSGSMNEFTSWKIAASFDYGGVTPSPSDAVYQNNDVLNGVIGYNYYDLYYFTAEPTNTNNEPKPFGLVPTPQFTLTVPNRIYMKNLFSDNSKVFYKPGSLASGGIGTVKNSRRKSTHT
jgi:hypothetical protein